MEQILSMIGWMFRLKVAMLGNQAGAVGYVFNQYPDFDDPNEIGVQVIFPNGDFDGFSVEEQKLFLEPIHPVLEYAGYEFKHVIQVSRDFEAGYWDFTKGA